MSLSLKPVHTELYPLVLQQGGLFQESSENLHFSDTPLFVHFTGGLSVNAEVIPVRVNVSSGS
jgi:hypothetical protein